MEALYFIGFLVTIYFTHRARRSLFPNQEERVQDYFTELDNKLVEQNLRLKLLKYANKIESQELMNLVKDESLSYGKLVKLAKKFKLK